MVWGAHTVLLRVRANRIGRARVYRVSTQRVLGWPCHRNACVSSRHASRWRCYEALLDAFFTDLQVPYERTARTAITTLRRAQNGPRQPWSAPAPVPQCCR